MNETKTEKYRIAICTAENLLPTLDQFSDAGFNVRQIFPEAQALPPRYVIFAQQSTSFAKAVVEKKARRGK